MKIALWIIAICEVIRLIQNTLQLFMMSHSRNDIQMKRATDAFVESLKKTDTEYVEDILEGIKDLK